MRALNSGVAAIAIVISLTASGAYAQAADGPAAGQQADQEAAKAQSGDHDSDIVVTAEKSGARRLQKVPLAIQAFDGAELKQRNINTVDDLVSAVPGAFEGQRQSVASRSYNLRGAGGSNANGDSPIGYYVDDVPFIVTNFGIAPPIRFQDL